MCTVVVFDKKEILRLYSSYLGIKILFERKYFEALCLKTVCGYCRGRVPLRSEEKWKRLVGHRMVN